MASFYDNLQRRFPPVVLNLVFINLIVWLFQLVAPSLRINFTNMMGMHYWEASLFRFWQPLSYMFLHSEQGISHLFWNMFALLMFGSHVERVLGTRRFLIFYAVCGLTAALSQEIVWTLQLHSLAQTYTSVNTGLQIMSVAEYFNLPITVGASGAIFGILLAFGMLFPNVRMFFFFIPIPIKAKYMVLIYGAIELFMGIIPTSDGVAHFAHLGGMIGGWILLIVWRKKRKISEPIF